MSEEIKIEAEIDVGKILNIPISPVPFEVSCRTMMNDLGFKFEDDGKPSAAINLNPVPIGRWQIEGIPESGNYKITQWYKNGRI